MRAMMRPLPVPPQPFPIWPRLNSAGTLPVDDETIKGRLYYVTRTFFGFLVSKRFWTYWTGHPETYEAGEIMVIYCVTAGRGQIQRRLITLNQTIQKRRSLFAVFVNCVVHRMYSLVFFQEFISRMTNNDFCLLYFKLLLLIFTKKLLPHRPTDACVVDPKVHKK